MAVAGSSQASRIRTRKTGKATTMLLEWPGIHGERRMIPTLQDKTTSGRVLPMIPRHRNRAIAVGRKAHTAQIQTGATLPGIHSRHRAIPMRLLATGRRNLIKAGRIKAMTIGHG